MGCVNPFFHYGAPVVLVPKEWNPVRSQGADLPANVQIWMFETNHGISRTVELIRELAPNQTLGIRHTPGGKPFLNGTAGFEFSISNQPGRALIAISPVCPIGVDLERIDPRRFREGMLESHCTPLERDRLENLSYSNKIEAFFELWVAKEAVYKALGLPIALGEIEIKSTNRGQDFVSHIPAMPGGPALISLHRLVVPEGWVGALARVVGPQPSPHPKPEHLG